MPKHDELKNRLEALFLDTDIPEAEVEVKSVISEPKPVRKSPAAPREKPVQKKSKNGAKTAGGFGLNQALFEKTCDPVFLLQDNLIVDLNQAAVELFCMEDKKAGVKRHLSDVSPQVQPDGRSSLEKANEATKTALENGSHRFEWMFRRINGELFPAEVTFTAVSHEETNYLYSAVREVRERRAIASRQNAAPALEEQQVQLTTRIAQNIAAAGNLEELYKRVVVDVKEWIGYYHVQLLRYDPTIDAVKLIAGYGKTGEVMLKAGHQMPLGKGLIGVAAESGATIMRPDLSSDPDWVPNPLLPETKGEIAVPIKFGTDILGVLDVQSSEVGGLGQDDQVLLEGLCGQIAIVMQSQGVLGLLNKRVRELNCLSDIGHKVDERPPLQEFLTWVCERIPGAMQYPEVCIAAITLGEAVYGQGDAQYLNRKMVGGIRVNNEVVGNLHIAYKDDLHFLDEESAFTGAIVGRVSSYLEAQQLLQQVQQRSEEVGILNQMGLELAAVLDVETICEAVYKYTQKLIQVPSFFIALYDETTQMLSIPVVYSQGKRIEGSSRPLGNALTDYVLRSGEPLLISDNVSERIEGLGIKRQLLANTSQMAESWLGVPINYGGKVLGAIVIQSVTTPGLYKENDKELLRMVASQAASAIENSRSFEQARLRSQELAVLNELGQKLTLMKNEEEILQTAYEYAGKLMDVTNFLSMFYDPRTSMASFPLVYFDGAKTELQAEKLGGGLSYRIISTRQPLLFSDRVIEQMREMGVDFVSIGDEDVPLSWLGVPLSFGETVLGVLSVQSTTTPRQFTERERELLLSIASLIAIALENGRSVAATRQRSEELTILNEMGRELATTVNISEIGELALEYTSKLMDTANFFLALFDENKGEVSFIITTLDNERLEYEDETTRTRPLGDGLTDYVIKTRKPLLLNGDLPALMKELGIAFRALGDDTPSLSWLGVPVIYANHVLAVIAVQSVIMVDHYTEIQRDLLVSLANQVAVAIMNLRQYEETQKALIVTEYQAKQLAAVTEVGAVASSTMDVQELLQRVVTLTQQAFEVYHCHVFLLDEELDELLIIACGWEPGGPNSGTHGLRSIPVSQEQSLVARAARTKQAVMVNDVIEDPGWLPNPQLPDTASELAVPMLVGEKVIGVLDVQAREKNRFTESDMQIQTTLASQIAVAVQNANQYQETQAALEKSESLYAASSRIVRSNTVQEVLESLIYSTALGLANNGMIIRFSENWAKVPPNFYRVEAVWERSKGRSALSAGTTLTRSQAGFDTYVRRDATTYILDTQTDRRLNPDLKAHYQDLGVQSLIIVPLLSGEEWIGLVYVQSSTMLALSDADLRRINTLVDQSAVVLDQLRLRQDMEERLRELLALQRSISRESWGSYLTAQRKVNWGFLYDRVGLQPVTPETTPAGVIPLVVRDQEIGKLGLVSDPADGEALSDDDLSMLQSVAEQLSQALERARLLEQTQKSAVELETVARVSSATSTILNPEDLLQSVVDLAKNSFGLYHAHIYLVDPVHTTLVLAAGAGEIGRSMVSEGWSIFMDENTVVTRTAINKEGQIVNNVREDPNFLPNPLLPETQSEMAVPIIVGQQLLGVFDVQSNRVDAFTEDDLRTYTTLASQTGVALQNARLFAEQSITVDRLRELDHLKSSFLANMSHELRTPLNSILGFTQVILEGIDGPLTDYMVADLQLIEKNGKHLLNLINEVLDMAKIESGRLTLTLESVDLRSMLQDVFETTSSQVREKNLYLDLNDRPEDDLEIMADQMRLRQVLLNLTSNAIKFTESGGVTVNIKRDSSWVYIRFVDTGIGVPVDKLEMIFEAFSQVDTSTTRKVGGTGLGLPISRRLIELHGGKLWAESSGVQGEGSTFCIDLPVQARGGK